jgi:hypothetical protein
MSVIALGLCAGLLWGCSDADQNRGNRVLIQVDDVIVTVSDFTQAFEILNAGSDLANDEDKQALTEARLALLNQMTEESLLLVRAYELNIQVSDEELETAVAAIKADYPEGEFEQVLLEYAVPYRFWLKRLRLRLLMDKVIDRELGAKVAITPEDIAAYYQRHYANQTDQDNPEQEDGDLEASIVQQLHREKTEKAYGTWIQGLKDKYPVDINEQEWEHLINA